MLAAAGVTGAQGSKDVATHLQLSSRPDHDCADDLGNELQSLFSTLPDLLLEDNDESSELRSEPGLKPHRVDGGATQFGESSSGFDVMNGYVEPQWSRTEVINRALRREVNLSREQLERRQEEWHHERNELERLRNASDRDNADLTNELNAMAEELQRERTESMKFQEEVSRLRMRVRDVEHQKALAEADVEVSTNELHNVRQLLLESERLLQSQSLQRLESQQEKVAIFQ